MKIEIINKKIFISLLSIFKSKKTVNLEITEENFLLECIELAKYYLNIPSTIVQANGTLSKITFDPSHLLNSLTILPTNTFEITNEHIIIFTYDSYIKIPLLSTTENEYEDIEDICTRFVVDNKTVVIFSNLKNLVKYEIEEEKLYLRKMGKEIIEEIEIKNISFIESGELSFLCNNEWSNCILPIYNYVEKALFLFSSNFLSVQFLFKNDEKIYFEVQVPRSLIKI